MATTPFILTSIDALYPHNTWVNAAPVKTASNVFNGADVAAYKGSAVAISDVTKLIAIPAGAFVTTVTYKVTTVEGGTCTFGIGDDAGTSGYASAVNGNTAAEGSSFNGTTTPTFGVGKYYAAADTIDLILSSGTAAALVVEISVTYIETLPRAV